MIQSFKIFNRFPELVTGMSFRKDGPMNIVSGATQKTFKNRQSYLRKLGIRGECFITAGLVHGNKIGQVNPKSKQKLIKNTDALITKDADLYLSVTNADCFPVLFYEPKLKIIAIAHVGWRGAQKNLVGKLVKLIYHQCNSNTKDLLVAVGPGIQPCHFEVRKDILPNFLKFSDSIVQKNHQTFINLPKIINQQLLTAGVTKKNLEISKDCTYHMPKKYFSYRRDKQINAMMSYIGRIAEI